jgi:hypothetical protein
VRRLISNKLATARHLPLHLTETRKRCCCNEL